MCLFYRPIGDQSPILPPHLVPELMSWALNCDASSRVVLALLKAWPYKEIHFLCTLHLAFESIPGHQMASFVFFLHHYCMHFTQNKPSCQSSRTWNRQLIFYLIKSNPVFATTLQCKYQVPKATERASRKEIKACPNQRTTAITAIWT